MIEPNITRYIWTHTRTQQAWVLSIVVISMIPYYMSFNLPKDIVNGPIQGAGFEEPGATQTFLRFAPDLPVIGQVTILPGWDLDRMGMLFALSFVFLGLVVVNGLFKFYINTYKGRLGERLLRRLRFNLIDHILRFPPATFKRLKPAEVAGMVKDEVEPMGGFAGEAFVTPALLGGQAATALLFIFVQSVPLGLMTAAIVAVQALLIPRLRRRLLVLGRQRQLTARELAGRVSEIVEGIQTVHAYDTSNWERADVGARLGRIFKIRFDIYQWKFMVKFINNFLAQVTPFLFYIVGGWLALNGRLDIGQLVAVIAAYKDLPGPLKELIDWDQNRQDVQVKYQTVVSQFAVEGVMDPSLQAVSVEAASGRLGAPLAAQGLIVADDSGAVALDGVTFALRPGETVALVGPTGSGTDTLAEALARVVWPTAGRVTAGETDLRDLPEWVTGRAVTYAGPDPFFFFGTVRDNLVYGLRHAPLREADLDSAARAHRDWARAEARRAGNPEHDVDGDWIDYAHAGCADPKLLWTQVFAALETVALTRDVLDFALRSSIDPAAHPHLAERIVAMRADLRTALRAQSLDDLIVPFEPGAYNAEAPVLENLLFGHARAPELGPSDIGQNSYFRTILAQSGLDNRLYDMGREIARTAVELFGDLPPDHPLLQQQTLVTADDLPDFSAILARLDAPGVQATAADRTRMIRLSFAYVEPRHRFGLMTPALMAEIVAFRAAFREAMPQSLRDGFEPYDPGRFIGSSTLLDNMLFGRISQKYRDGTERIYGVVTGLLQPLGLHDAVLNIGLEFHMGSGGKRLTAAQRQKLALARALLRQSDYYVFNRPLSALDPRTQDQLLRATLAHLRRGGRSPGIAWALATPLLAAQFDRVAVLDKGRIVEEGSVTELTEKNGFFAGMMSA
ncbi:MAG: ATP-binding cassette domain-containing protein [Paracoccaceae bacterium]|nr:MAG: ATP-binding cassette domain-containing protein [Paracoccaceae bacterium]